MLFISGKATPIPTPPKNVQTEKNVDCAIAEITVRKWFAKVKKWKILIRKTEQVPADLQLLMSKSNHSIENHPKLYDTEHRRDTPHVSGAL